MSELKKVHLGIVEFAMPAPRTGSIDIHSGYGRSAQDGIEIHQRVQEERQKEDPNYQAEVKISHEFEREGYLFHIEGRMDGYSPAAADVPSKIEEIKSAFNIWELSNTLKIDPINHPYCLQLLTYGYLFYIQNGLIPQLSFHLVSIRNSQEINQSIELNLSHYEAWLDRRLRELVSSVQKVEKQTKRRIKASRKFPFPFENPRSGQLELIEAVENGMKNKKRLLFQAPTGLGKTVGVLYPSLKEAISRGQRVVYVTPKNSQHRVAEDAVELFQKDRVPIKSLTVTAKSKMCLKEEPLCNPKYCEFARDYYDKLIQNDLVEVLAKKKKLTARIFRALGEKHEVCPFELQLDVAHQADVVICDYNYVFAPRSSLRQPFQPSFLLNGKPNLVIDEAHNLPSRAMSYYSPSLSSAYLESLRPAIRLLSRAFSIEGERLLDACQKIIHSYRPKTGPRSLQITLNLDPFLHVDAELREFLTSYLNSDSEIAQRDPVLKLRFYWSDFTAVLENLLSSKQPEFFVSFQAPDTLRITCCDASKMLKPAYDEYANVVGFSATLKPFDFYAKLSGLSSDDLETIEFHSPFETSKRKVLIIPQVSTKYSDRERNYSRIAETILRIVALRRGNYFVFFPSFGFLDRVSSFIPEQNGFQVIRQSPRSKISDVDAVLDALKNIDPPKLVLGVQGGVFSEGIDYPGKMLIGAFVIGPPLPVFDVEREGMRKYYDIHYGKGFDFAYVYPAMAKAVQAAGRVIRSENDHGIVVLMDNRFLESSYAQTMPSDWFNEHPSELVSKSILNDVSEFWAGNS